MNDVYSAFERGLSKFDVELHVRTPTRKFVLHCESHTDMYKCVQPPQPSLSYPPWPTPLNHPLLTALGQRPSTSPFLPPLMIRMARPPHATSLGATWHTLLPPPPLVPRVRWVKAINRAKDAYAADPSIGQHAQAAASLVHGGGGSGDSDGGFAGGTRAAASASMTAIAPLPTYLEHVEEGDGEEEDDGWTDGVSTVGEVASAILRRVATRFKRGRQETRERAEADGVAEEEYHVADLLATATAGSSSMPSPSLPPRGDTSRPNLTRGSH